MADTAIAHIDLDAFFVSVERLRNSKLEGRPLIIGGTSGRGVVASCSYEARKLGVYSAMPMRMARQLCPEAVVIGGDMDAYTRYSRLVTEVIADAAPLFEKASIDEFYLDITGMDRFFGCYKWTTELRQRIAKETGLPLSFGLSVNKTVSKVGTGEAKPNGQMRIPFGGESSFMAPLPVSKLPLVGERTARSLRCMGVRTVGKLAEIPSFYLEKAFGKTGRILWKRANGMDNTPVTPYREQRSVSAEHTLQEDTVDRRIVRSLLGSMAEKLTYELRARHKLTACVAVKIRYSDFRTVTRQARVPYTAADHVLIPRVKELFEAACQRRIRVRLVGVRFSDLVRGGHQLGLFDADPKLLPLYDSMDRIRDRFGTGAIRRGHE